MSVAEASDPTGSPGALEGAGRILAVRLDAMGDVLMTTPALRAIRRTVPDARLTLLTSPAGASVARLLPEVDEVVTYEAPWMKVPAPRDPGADRAFVEALVRRQEDAAIIFTVNTQSALPAAVMTYLAGIPVRAAHARENPYHLLSHWIRDPEPDLPVRHEVRRQLDLVAALGATADDDHLSLRVPPGASRAVRRRLEQLGLLDGRPWAVVHPGASAPSRRYPVDGFAAVADGLADRGWRMVLTGGPDEGPLVEGVRARMRHASIPLHGRLDLGELAALLSVAPLLVANNAGPVHVAAAVGTPVVVTYALTNRQHTPWGVPSRVLSHDVPCRDCLRSVCPMGHHRCLTGIAPEAVVEAALELVGDGRAPRTGRRLPVVA